MPAAPDVVLKELQENKYAPLYFLHGEEPFYIDRVSDYIEQHALSDAEKGFNQHIFYGKDVQLRMVLENARRFPMMAQRQVIIVKEAQELSDLKQKTGQEALSTYAKKPVPSTVLVFCYKHKKLDSRTELAKTLDKQAVLVESKRLYDNQVPEWIKGYCVSLNCLISGKATMMLSEYIGNDLNRIAKEIDKLLISHDKTKEITEEVVAKQVGISKEHNVFELQSALAKRDVLKANRIINYFESNIKNNPVIPMISMLFSYFSKVLLVHHNKGKNQKELAGLLKINPYFVKEYLLAARNYPLGKTIAVIEELHQADLKSKGVDASISDGQLMKELVYKILH
ncbi:MAG: DNA polymerase III subunit delta [Flammeovirgaceae bacterium]